MINKKNPADLYPYLLPNTRKRSMDGVVKKKRTCTRFFRLFETHEKIF